MRAHTLPSRRLAALVIPLAAAGLLAGLVPAAAASAASCQAWTGVQPPNPGTADANLAGVTVLSPCNAWAVGFAGGTAQTLIEHWNGSSWRVVPSPDPGTALNVLNGVRAVSASNIWAVGEFGNGTDSNHALILHWNGTAWKQAASQDPGISFSVLSGVRGTSARDVWAVGDYLSGSSKRTLIEHWNGSAWRQVPSPDPAHDNVLTAVAATSASNAWAVGYTGLLDKTLILHWNGKKWSRMPSPSPGPGNFLAAIGATSATNAWAVGATDTGSTRAALILHWNGKRWSRIASHLQGAAVLNGVTATSPASAFAVGAVPGTTHTALILAWNGTSWVHVRAPSPSVSSDYFAVGASSASNVWAVGGYNPGSGPLHTFAAHCC